MTTKTIDQTQPGDKWEFDSSVTAAFDNMLERSIPQYEVMRRACFDLACKYAKRNTTIADLGCSRGEAIGALVDKFGAHNHFVGLEVSGPMLEAARQRFQGLIDCSVVEVREWDLRRKDYPLANVSVTLAVLTVQFVPIEYRLRLLRNIYQSLNAGGALIFVEKVLGSTADLDTAMVDTYYALKAQNGYSQEQIERKRLSLEGVLVPVTARWNEELLHSCGFAEVDCFWRWMNFAGWIAVK
jgi:tRNA (cmo5U34)-methyltransferase